jgi:alkylation response protein AidB-like acyl-CoA dehydrogenase
VAFGGQADALVVTATRDQALVLGLVDARQAEITPIKSFDPCVEYARVRFVDVPLEEEHVIAAGAGAATLREQVHASLRLMSVAELSGVASEMTSRAVDYAKQRTQFGRTIGGFQAVRHILSTMTGRSSALLSLSEASLADGDEDASRLPYLGRLVKAYSSDVSRYVAEQALQVHGGIAFTHELPLHLFLRRVLTLQGYLGEAPHLYADLGRSALEGR